MSEVLRRVGAATGLSASAIAAACFAYSAEGHETNAEVAPSRVVYQKEAHERDVNFQAAGAFGVIAVYEAVYLLGRRQRLI